MKETSCTINGTEYESESAAAKALKIGVGTVRMRLKSSNYPEYISKHHPKKKRRKGVYSRKARGYRRCLCTIKGVRYESMSEAARAMGISIPVLRTRLCSSNFPEYISKHHPKIQREQAGISCTIKGVKYPSVVAAARKFKVSRSTISNRLKSFDYPDYVCADIPKAEEPLKPPMYSYVVNGKKYRTLQEIANVEGLTRERIRQKMNNPKKPEYQRLKRGDGY